jgi:hypothetical protein
LNETGKPVNRAGRISPNQGCRAPEKPPAKYRRIGARYFRWHHDPALAYGCWRAAWGGTFPEPKPNYPGMTAMPDIGFRLRRKYRSGRLDHAGGLAGSEVS